MRENGAVIQNINAIKNPESQCYLKCKRLRSIRKNVQSKPNETSIIGLFLLEINLEMMYRVQ